MNSIQRGSKKVLVGILGGVVVLLGLILIPYPGPGWLVTFGGLAILATEFAFAAKLLSYGREKYDAWTAWLTRQRLGVRIVVLSFTVIVVIATLWLVNAYGIIADVLQLPYEWLRSPFVHF